MSSALKKGMKATIHRNSPVSLQAAQAAGTGITHIDRFQTLLNEAKAKCWQASNEDERFKVAEELLWALIAVTHELDSKDAGIAWTIAADKIWAEYAADHKLCAETNGGEFYPTELWIRHAFAHTVSKNVRQRDPATILGFRVRGWGNPILLLEPQNSKCFEWPDNTHYDVIEIPQVIEVPA